MSLTDKGSLKCGSLKGFQDSLNGVEDLSDKGSIKCGSLKGFHDSLNEAFYRKI